MLGTYAKAAAALVPARRRLPFVAGGGGDDARRRARRARASRSTATTSPPTRASAGSALRDELPPTYPHMLAFPLHMELMTDGRFPFPASGSCTSRTASTVHRPLRAGEPLDLAVRATPVEPHPKGRTFSIVTEARVDDEVVWEETSTMLRRGGGSGDGEARHAAPRHEPPDGVGRVEAARRPRPPLRRRCRATATRSTCTR